MEINKERYIYDPLYGPIYLPDFIWNYITVPELQRLREIRLCNINSLFITGASNINRFEHSIGTCYLAWQCIKNWPPLNPIYPQDKKNLLLAALFHDITSTPFGHSLQYVEEKDGFEHERFLYAIDSIQNSKKNNYEYKGSTLEPIFFGMYRELSNKLSDKEKREIDDIISGKGRYGPLINSLMDLDNIDNVYRMSYHIGLPICREIPLKLAKSLYIKNNQLKIKNKSINLVKKWYLTRVKLYKLLLLNPEEFSAKCMLNDAIEFSKIAQHPTWNWFDIDYELLNNLKNMKNPDLEYLKEDLGKLKIHNFNFFQNRYEKNKLLNHLKKNNIFLEGKKISFEKYGKGYKLTVDRKKFYFEKNEDNSIKLYLLGPYKPNISSIITRLMKGELYGCIGIFSTDNLEINKLISNNEIKNILESKISLKIKDHLINKIHPIISIHTIEDYNKTKRQIKIEDSSGKWHTIGHISKDLFIGVFLRNKKLDIYQLNKLPLDLNLIREKVSLILKKLLCVLRLKGVNLYNEIQNIE